MESSSVEIDLFQRSLLTAMNAVDSDIHPWKKCINCDFRAEKNKDWQQISGKSDQFNRKHVDASLKIIPKYIPVQLRTSQNRRRKSYLLQGQVGEVLREMWQGWCHLFNPAP